MSGIDIGLRTVKLVRGYYKGNTFHVDDFAVAHVDSREIQDGWSALRADWKPGLTRVGLTGRDVNIRYTRVPRVPDWQLRNLMRFEVEEIGDQSGSGVASDFNLLPQLPEIEGEDVVLLALAREALLESHIAGLSAVGGTLDSFSPNAVALYNAFLRYGVVQDETVLLANIGYDNVDVVIARGPDLIFARNLSGGSRLFDETIAQRFEVSTQKAIEIKEKLATLDAQTRFIDANQEKASRAIMGAAGQLLSLLQSTVMFCKSQVKISGLKLDRVLLCGGGAALAGLPKYLSAGMSVPVELFDPWRVIDVAALPPAKQQLLEQHKLEAVVALGLATMSSDENAYSIEILPKSVQKRREFLGGQLFLIASGALALAYLGFDAWNTRVRLGEARQQAQVLDRQYKSASSIHRKAEELMAENQRLAAQASDLSSLKGSGEQLARTLNALESELPGGFWVTQLTSDFRFDHELGIERGAERPILSIVGKASEGAVQLSTSYEAFIQGLRSKLPGATVLKERLTPSGSKFTLDLSMYAPPPAEVTEAEDAPSPTPKKGG